MVKEVRGLIEIDLDQFKLHLKIRDKTGLSLHFDSPSRRFYISVIALVVNEMKRLGKITSIPLEPHYHLLALFNETVGGSAGSSEKENLLPRIYKKWKGALPDLEHAPLFNVLGRRKEYEDAAGKSYSFTDEEKDIWANLFEYKGSGENVRLRFSIDKLGANLNDVLISYGEGEDVSDVTAWERYVDSLKAQMKDKPEPAVSKEPAREISGGKKWGIGRSALLNKTTLVAFASLLLTLALIAFWNIYFNTPKSRDGAAIELALNPNEEPAIAVLPFKNLSNEIEQEYISDGITEQIITGLSRVPKLLVIARNSTFTYKGKLVKAQQVARELGVNLLLEGSVQRSNNRLRITAQLIDALSGHHIWAQTYDRELKDILAMQDEITMKIIGSLQLKLTEGEYARALAKGTKNLEAYLKCLQAIQLSRRLTQEDDLLAREMYREVIALDPNYATPYAYLGSTYRKAVSFGWSRSPKTDLARAEELVRKAIELDDSLGLPHRFLADIYVLKKEWDKAIEEAERGVSIDPNPQTMYGLAYHLSAVGRHEEAIALIKKTFRLDPIPPAMYIWILGNCYFLAEQYDEALAEYKRVLDRRGEFSPKYTHLALARTYAMLGRDEKARHHVAEVLRIDPKYTLKGHAKRTRLFFKNQAEADRIVNALGKAELPEKPPLQ